MELCMERVGEPPGVRYEIRAAAVAELLGGARMRTLGDVLCRLRERLQQPGARAAVVDARNGRAPLGRLSSASALMLGAPADTPAASARAVLCVSMFDVVAAAPGATESPAAAKRRAPKRKKAPAARPPAVEMVVARAHAPLVADMLCAAVCAAAPPPAPADVAQCDEALARFMDSPVENVRELARLPPAHYGLYWRLAAALPALRVLDGARTCTEVLERAAPAFDVRRRPALLLCDDFDWHARSVALEGGRVRWQGADGAALVCHSMLLAVELTATDAAPPPPSLSAAAVRALGVPASLVGAVLLDEGGGGGGGGGQAPVSLVSAAQAVRWEGEQLPDVSVLATPLPRALLPPCALLLLEEMRNKPAFKHRERRTLGNILRDVGFQHDQILAFLRAEGMTRNDRLRDVLSCSSSARLTADMYAGTKGCTPSCEFLAEDGMCPFQELERADAAALLHAHVGVPDIEACHAAVATGLTPLAKCNATLVAAFGAEAARAHTPAHSTPGGYAARALGAWMQSGST